MQGWHCSSLCFHNGLCPAGWAVTTHWHELAKPKPHSQPQTCTASTRIALKERNETHSSSTKPLQVHTMPQMRQTSPPSSLPPQLSWETCILSQGYVCRTCPFWAPQNAKLQTKYGLFQRGKPEDYWAASEHGGRSSCSSAYLEAAVQLHTGWGLQFKVLQNSCLKSQGHGGKSQQHLGRTPTSQIKGYLSSGSQLITPTLLRKKFSDTLNTTWI